MSPQPDVDLVVNCYERTYRDVLRPGFMAAIPGPFAARHVIVNNVDDPADAAGLADRLVESGEITRWHFVADRLDEALRVTGMSRRALRHRPYFLDYGLVMTVTGDSPYLVGWDAEATVDADWVTPGLALLARRPDVFSAAPRWPVREADTLDTERVAEDGDWVLNWGFSDQAFLVRRAELAAPIFRRLAPSAFARHHDHPWSFESRTEAYQRAARRYRASLRTIAYGHNDIDEVVRRLGGPSPSERFQRAVLRRLERLFRRSPVSIPAWSLP